MPIFRRIRRARVWPLLAASILTPLAGVGAQTVPTLQAGQRVRVTAPDRGLVEQPGSLEALRDDSALIVTVGGRVRILPIATVTRLEVGTRHGHPWRGAAIGTGIGTLAGVLAYVGVVRGE
ncbi:MAG: hypothetical protein OEW06_11605, partial [Gemmatimonadota bacterium]|nr:hypothetical protein [Gemmatimonadota bacterium]